VRGARGNSRPYRNHFLLHRKSPKWREVSMSRRAGYDCSQRRTGLSADGGFWAVFWTQAEIDRRVLRVQQAFGDGHSVSRL
jgi:hypothetical protein